MGTSIFKLNFIEYKKSRKTEVFKVLYIESRLDKTRSAHENYAGLQNNKPKNKNETISEFHTLS